MLGYAFIFFFFFFIFLFFFFLFHLINFQHIISITPFSTALTPGAHFFCTLEHLILGGVESAYIKPQISFVQTLHSPELLQVSSSSVSSSEIVKDNNCFQAPMRKLKIKTLFLGEV
jgi:hypothetical protein